MSYIMKSGITLFFLVNCASLFSQFNFQTGYDLGVIKFPKPLNYDDFELNVNADFSREKNINFLHRYNFLGEYKLSNNMVTSLTFGFDNYRNRFVNSSSQILQDGCIVRNRLSEYHANINTLRFELSLGYDFELTDNSSIVLKGNYGVSIIANHKILKSTRTTIEEKECSGFPHVQNTSMIDFINLSNNYGDRIKTDWNQISVSAEYRHIYNNLNFNIYSAFMPLFNPDFLAGTSAGSGGAFVFILGLRFGYTLPQKNKNDEK